MTLGQMITEIQASLKEISTKFTDMLKSNRYIESQITDIKEDIKSIKHKTKKG